MSVTSMYPLVSVLVPMIELEDRDGLKPSVAGAAVPGMGAKPLVAAFIRQGLRIELKI